jgi:acetyl esterase/lipase
MAGWAVLDALGVGLAVLLLAWTSLLYVPFRWRPVGRYLFVPKLAAAAFTPFVAAAGLLLALVGGLRGWWWMAVPAALAAVGASIVVVRLGLVRADLAAALGPGWADRYAQLSPVHHVHLGCPPTLLLHGQHDEMAPVAATRHPHQRLEQAGVPVTAVYLPHTDHAFDLVGTAWSPQARTAIQVLERFLAVLAATDQRPRTRSGHHPQAR